jgi:predicted PurR-regulated permease PerM
MLKARSFLVQISPASAFDHDEIRVRALSLARSMGSRFAGVSASILGSLTSFMVNSFLLLFVLFFVQHPASVPGEQPHHSSVYP